MAKILTYLLVIGSLLQLVTSVHVVLDNLRESHGDVTGARKATYKWVKRDEQAVTEQVAQEQAAPSQQVAATTSEIPETTNITDNVGATKETEQQTPTDSPGTEDIASSEEEDESLNGENAPVPDQPEQKAETPIQVERVSNSTGETDEPNQPDAEEPKLATKDGDEEVSLQPEQVATSTSGTQESIKNNTSSTDSETKQVEISKQDNPVQEEQVDKHEATSVEPPEDTTDSVEQAKAKVNENVSQVVQVSPKETTTERKQEEEVVEDVSKVKQVDTDEKIKQAGPTENNTIPIDPQVANPIETTKTSLDLPDYLFPDTSCNDIVPDTIMNMTLDRILKVIHSDSCNNRLALRLQPASNKLIKGQVMEINSVPIVLSDLLTNTYGQVKVFCVRDTNSSSSTGGHGKKVKFQLKLEIQNPLVSLKNSWRQYPTLQLDDIPIGNVFSKNNNLARQIGNKCNRFRVLSGDLSLSLLDLNASLLVEVSLSQLDGRSFAASKELGGDIHIRQFTLDRVYLEQTLTSSDSLTPTVQILHDSNSHHRRNEWLFDMYGNWLKHEYRNQLRHLFISHLAESLDSCFVN